MLPPPAPLLTIFKPNPFLAQLQELAAIEVLIGLSSHGSPRHRQVLRMNNAVATVRSRGKRQPIKSKRRCKRDLKQFENEEHELHSVSRKRMCFSPSIETCQDKKCCVEFPRRNISREKLGEISLSDCTNRMVGFSRG